jgi:hypothetical protein
MKLKVTGVITVQYRPIKLFKIGSWQPSIGKTRRTVDRINKLFQLFDDAKPRSYNVTGDLKVSLFIEHGVVWVVPSVHGYTIGDFQAFDLDQKEMLVRVNQRGVVADLHLTLIS